MPNCLNCDTDLAGGKFCAQCGQSAAVSRLNRKTMRDEFLRVFMNIDRGLFYTLGQIYTRPGFAALDFVQGKRIRFFKPLTAMAIISAAAETAVKRYHADFSPWFELYDIPRTIFSLMFIGAILSGWIIRDQRYNFWERLMLHLFVNLGAMLLVAVGAFALPELAFLWFCYSLPVIYACGLAIAYWQFFSVQTAWGLCRSAITAGLLTIWAIRDLN